MLILLLSLTTWTIAHTFLHWLVRTVNYFMVSLLPGQKLDIKVLSVLGCRYFWSLFFKLSCSRVKHTFFRNFRLFGLACRFYTYKTQDFIQVTFRTAKKKNKVTALPVTRASLGKWSVLTIHKEKSGVTAKKKLQNTTNGGIQHLV